MSSSVPPPPPAAALDDKAETGSSDLEKGAPDAAAKPVLPDPAAFPDGGRQAWLTVAGASACLFCSFGWINAVGIFQNVYQTDFLRNYSASEVSWIPSLQVFFMLFCGPFAGKLFDDYGPRVPLALGAFLHVFGLMMLSISREYYQILLSQSVCSAIGASLAFQPAMACVTTYFLKRRGLAIGITAAGSSLGGVIFPIMVTRLIPEVGFGWTIRICAFLILALLTFANLVTTSRIKPTKRPFHAMAFVRPLLEPNFALLCVGVFFTYWAMFVPFTFIVEEALTKNVDPSFATYLVPILNAASIIGRTVPNAIADKVGYFNMMIAMSGLTTVIILAVWLPVSGQAGLIAFAVFIGISTGAGIGLTPVLAAKLSKIQEIGVRTGTVFGFASVAALTGSPIGGAIVGAQRGSYMGCIIFAGIAGAVATSFFTVTRFSHAGKAIKA